MDDVVNESAQRAKGSLHNLGLTPLDAAQKTLLRLQYALFALVPLIAGGVGEAIIADNVPRFQGIAIVPAALAALSCVTALPGRIYRRWGYDMGAQELRVLRGFLWRTDTIVPFNRIQHIDVAQGPLQRVFGLSSLVVHTAGTHNSIVTLPGLDSDTAEAMRETIKTHIRRDMV